MPDKLFISPGLRRRINEYVQRETGREDFELIPAGRIPLHDAFPDRCGEEEFDLYLGRDPVNGGKTYLSIDARNGFFRHFVVIEDGFRQTCLFRKNKCGFSLSTREANDLDRKIARHVVNMLKSAIQAAKKPK